MHVCFVCVCMYMYMYICLGLIYIYMYKAYVYMYKAYVYIYIFTCTCTKHIMCKYSANCFDSYFLYTITSVYTCTCTIGWTTTPSPVDVTPCVANVGPLVPASRDPLVMFSSFFDDSLIVRETNRYAAQCLTAANKDTTWETNVEELKAFLGFMIVMGVNRLPEVRDY